MLTPGGRRVVVKARSMACPACGETNRPQRLYGARCGARLAAPCPACAAPSEPGEEFCGQCGLALAGGRPAVAPAPAMPATIAGGCYQLRCLLGEGGKKRVYLATDTRLARGGARAPPAARARTAPRPGAPRAAARCAAGRGAPRPARDARPPGTGPPRPRRAA